MSHWLDAFATPAAPAILVTVATVEGSGPREPGAKMAVTQDRLFDTIGGGHLEMCATDIAREMLSMPAGSISAERRLQRFSLGPSLGQCCGGVVHLAFERIDAAARNYVDCLSERRRDRQDSWRLVSLDSMEPPALYDAAATPLAGTRSSALIQIEHSRSTHLARDSAGRLWLVDPCLAYRPHLLLFGAGHVGAALVRALAELPCHVTWIDERDDMFPATLPANVKIEATDIPEALIDAAAPGTSFLVMTHSHALDQRLTEHILRHADFNWFGLIGSKTKRKQFEHRLRERGIAAERLAAMTCPIGLPGIRGKAPAVVAAAVAAQLLQVWEEAQQASEGVPPLRLATSSY